METSRTALVTGAGGFLGSRIVTELVRAGYSVTGVDRGHAALAGDTSAWHVMSLPDESFRDLLVEVNPEVIVHAAGPASVSQSIADPAADFEGAVRVSAHVLDSIRRADIDPRIILLSSAAVYGEPAVLPVNESADCRPMSPYGFHKQMVESLAREYHDVYGLRTGCLRIFSAYGAGLDRQLLWDVCEKATAGDVRLYGTGEESRDFVHASDVAQAVRVVTENAALEGEGYNVASGVETTVREVAETIVEFVAPGTPVTFSGETRLGDPARWRADITAISRLGFAPSIDLRTGIRQYCDWYRDTKTGDSR